MIIFFIQGRQLIQGFGHVSECRGYNLIPQRTTHSPDTVLTKIFLYGVPIIWFIVVEVFALLEQVKSLLGFSSHLFGFRFSHSLQQPQILQTISQRLK